MTTPRCVLCGRPEDEATPSFSTYLHGVDSRCPECGKPQGVDLVARAAVESDLEDFDRLKDLILTLLPYAIDDGEDPPNEANAEECVEYAADEIARLRSKNAALRAAMTEAASVMESIYESFRDGKQIDPADVDIGIGCWLAKHATRSLPRLARRPWPAPEQDGD